ncbi:MAG: hypothetical protein HY020_08350 [Burkholderiales bacterium]|nr:hypothetical protein [Burkholderiales bacterium]
MGPAEVLALIERLQQQATADVQDLAPRGRELTLAQAKIDKLNLELAQPRRWQSDAKIEAMTAARTPRWPQCPRPGHGGRAVLGSDLPG